MTERPLLAPANLDAARRAQEEFGLCDACLGRRFGKVETGLTNQQRGALVREAIGASEVAPSACFVCEGLSADTDLFAEAAVAAMAPYEHRHFLVGTRVDPAIESRDAEVNAALGTAATAERIQAELNRETGKKVAARSGKPVDLKAPDLAAVVDTRFLDAELQHGGLCVFGRYRKLDRTIPQTRWPCRRCQGKGCVECHETGKQYATSVEELVAAPFLDATGATEESFHGAGREDIDARTLGTGRPFILELKDPRVREIDLARFPPLVQEVSGGRVEVEGLRFAPKAEIVAIKEHRGSKTYRAVVAFQTRVSEASLRSALDVLRGATIQQRTPERVQHRRADLVRERRVLDIQAEAHHGETATIRVHGDAGLYIKELISGDEGRTEPSLAGLLGVGAKVTELDILAVEYEAPSST
ncbi:MAG: tRNA pseudouridine synthase 10 [Thermoplasmata archaeon]|jgi:tRNA pseudouridine synthase 10|nr:tRNA pseudouridine synthase 10 [Thermoplasmata archaeon]